jgi:hypothetical protein
LRRFSGYYEELIEKLNLIIAYNYSFLKNFKLDIETKYLIMVRTKKIKYLDQEERDLDESLI